MFMPAVSSIAARRDTMAPSLLSSLLPIASVVVVTISIAMGIEATSSTRPRPLSPEPAAIIRRAPSRAVRNMPRVLTASTLSKSSMAMSRMAA